MCPSVAIGTCVQVPVEARGIVFPWSWSYKQL